MLFPTLKNPCPSRSRILPDASGVSRQPVDYRVSPSGSSKDGCFGLKLT